MKNLPYIQGLKNALWQINQQTSNRKPQAASRTPPTATVTFLGATTSNSKN